MALGALLGIAGTVKKIGGAVGGAINSGTCGKKCYGIGKTLRKCRERRKADCESAESQKAEQRREAEQVEMQVMQQKNAKYQAAAAVSSGGFAITPGIGLAIGGGLLGFIFLMFNFMMKR